VTLREFFRCVLGGADLALTVLLENAIGENYEAEI
jgi:hypothetical protein